MFEPPNTKVFVAFNNNNPFTTCTFWIAIFVPGCKVTDNDGIEEYSIA